MSGEQREMLLYKNYCVSVQVAIPVYVRHSLSWLGGTQGRFDITVGPKQTMGRTVEKVFNFNSEFCLLLILINQVKIEIAMHKSVLNCSLTPTQGKYSFDPVSEQPRHNNNLHEQFPQFQPHIR